MKIAFFDTKPYDEKSFRRLNEEGKYGFKIKYFESKLTEDTVVLTKGYDVVCAFVNDTLDKQVIDGLVENGIKLIAMRCAGYNNVDMKTAYGRIQIVRVPAYSPYAVAEHAVALMMTLNRKTHKAYSRTRENNFNINGFTGFDLHGKTVGVIGTGKIGQIFGQICKGFGMKVLAYDKYPNDTLGFEYVALDRLYSEADVISLHCPLVKDTKYMINARSINLMKEGVMLINTSRGGLVHTEDLIGGLKIRKIGAAGLDVYEEEGDYFFEDLSTEIMQDDTLARLLTFNNVLVTSHQAFLTQEALENIATTTLDNINEFIEKEKTGENIRISSVDDTTKNRDKADKNKGLTNEICYRC